MTADTGHAVRDAVGEDVDGMVELFHRQRLRYEQFSPVMWRVAADARERHRPFLAALVQAPEVLTLVSGGGVLIALDRGERGWLIDDFAVPDDGDWAGAGAALLDAALARLGPPGAPVTVVCGHRHEAKRTMLRARGFVVGEEWWVRPTVAADFDGDGRSDDYAVTVTGAPPVYDPGGPVMMTDRLGADAAAVRGLVAEASTRDVVLTVVPVVVDDVTRRDLLGAHGFELTAEWYELG